MISDTDSNLGRLESIRDAARMAVAPLEPAGKPKSSAEPKGLFLATRTKAGRDLPEYCLVYFLLVDLLGFPHLGRWEKSAWTVPVRLHGRLYAIEHRKMGVGIFEPNHDPHARRSGKPTETGENDAREIVALINSGVRAAAPYFEWRAEEAVSRSELNVNNNCCWLFDRYSFFRCRYDEVVSADRLKKATVVPFQNVQAECYAQAAIEAFFSWTEHVFIHLAILQGRLSTGKDVARLAGSEWKEKFKIALGLEEPDTKRHYDRLLGIRVQVRNYLAHGAFGKRGEAFRFHSNAGAVPVLLTQIEERKYSINGKPAFKESAVLEEIDGFIEHLWARPRKAAHAYISSGLPSILSFVEDGTYEKAMNSEADMETLVNDLTRQLDAAANMEW